MSQKRPKYVPRPRLVCVELNPGPGRGHEWSEEQKWRVVLLWKDQGKEPATIAEELNINSQSVARLIEKYKKTGTVHRQPGQGRKHKLNTREELRMEEKAKRRKCAPAIAQDYNRHHEAEMSMTG